MSGLGHIRSVDTVMIWNIWDNNVINIKYTQTPGEQTKILFTTFLNEERKIPFH